MGLQFSFRDIHHRHHLSYMMDIAYDKPPEHFRPRTAKDLRSGPVAPPEISAFLLEACAAESLDAPSFPLVEFDDSDSHSDDDDGSRVTETAKCRRLLAPINSRIFDLGSKGLAIARPLATQLETLLEDFESALVVEHAKPLDAIQTGNRQSQKRGGIRPGDRPAKRSKGRRTQED